MSESIIAEQPQPPDLPPEAPPPTAAENAQQRRMDVLRMTAEGRSRSEIAAAVGLSLTSIDNIRARNNPGRGGTKPRTRLKRAYQERDPGLAGVGSTEPRKARPEDMPRQAPMGAGELTRIPLDEREVTSYDLPDHLRKSGWDYKWQVTHVRGEPALRSSMRDAQKSGWQIERTADWPGVADPTAKPDDPVEEGGQVLMGRPQYLSDQATLEMYNRGKQQERDRMHAAAGGADARGGAEGPSLGSLRGVQVRGQTLEVQLAMGSAPIPTRR